MPFNDKNIKRDSNGIPIPQIFNTEANDYEALLGRNGATFFQQRGTMVVDHIEDTKNLTKTYTNDCWGASILNDGNANLTMTINSMVITVKPGRVYSALFSKSFKTVTVAATSNFILEILE